MPRTVDRNKRVDKNKKILILEGAGSQETNDLHNLSII